jgi:hypothetical protein
VSKGGISPSGRALRAVLWRLPLGATKFSIARNTAAATEEGRRIMALIGFGAWVAVFWYVASFLHAAVGLLWSLQLAGLFGLLLIWRIIGLARRWWAHRRNLASMARNAQIQREIYQAVTQFPDLMRQYARQAAPGGGHTMPNLLRHHDPEYETQRQEAREQADRSRSWLPVEQQDMPLGDRHDPVFPMPKWMRRRRPKDGDQ